jgi:hypothetical protein
MGSAIIRMIVSLPPPAGHGTMSVMGLLGNASPCAAAIAGQSAQTPANAHRSILTFIAVLLLFRQTLRAAGSVQSFGSVVCDHSCG